MKLTSIKLSPKEAKGDYDGPATLGRKTKVRAIPMAWNWRRYT